MLTVTSNTEYGIDLPNMSLILDPTLGFFEGINGRTEPKSVPVDGAVSTGIPLPASEDGDVPTGMPLPASEDGDAYWYAFTCI